MNEYIIIGGTRPEIIKLSPILRELDRQKRKYTYIFSGQHFSKNMSDNISKDLELKKPDYFLKLKEKEPGAREGEIITKISKILAKKKKSLVVVLGDVDTTLAGAIAAKRQGFKLAHVESGYRSFDERMPEEMIRITVDHMSDVLFAPTNDCLANLKREGIDSRKVYFTGNTVQDACNQGKKIAKKKSKILNKIPKKYALLTLHRQENVDDKKKLKEFLDAFKKIDIPIIWPIHPRTRKNTEEFKLKLPKNIILLEPQGYLDFLMLLSSAEAILTDSGGIQEEACSLNIPCLVMRKSTEYVEAVKSGKIIIAYKRKEIERSLDKILNDRKFRKEMIKAKNPYTKNNVGKKIISILDKFS